MEQERIKIKGYIGTWSVINEEKHNGVRYQLLESEQFGDDAPSIIVDDSGNVVLDEVYNGFLDLKDYLDN